MSGYFQLVAEPYVMTQGGPLESTKSVLYLMYDEGFKWWNLGNASAVAFLLFVLMVPVPSGLLWFARRKGVECTVPSPPPSSMACWSRWACSAWRRCFGCRRGRSGKPPTPPPPRRPPSLGTAPCRERGGRY